MDSIVIPNGIHPEYIKVREQKNVNEGLHIVQVSRLHHEKKGQDILIDALANLKGKGFENVFVDLIGDGASKEFLEKLCVEKGVDKNVRFLGTQTQEYVFKHLADYDLFVQPSRHEGFALTVAEAMAAKVPVLVASGQGPEEVVDYGNCGYVFRNGDVIDCSNKIKEIIENGENQGMTNMACERVWKLYNVSVTANAYLNNYLRRK